VEWFVRCGWEVVGSEWYVVGGYWRERSAGERGEARDLAGGCGDRERRVRAQPKLAQKAVVSADEPGQAGCGLNSG